MFSIPVTEHESLDPHFKVTRDRIPLSLAQASMPGQINQGEPGEVMCQKEPTSMKKKGWASLVRVDPPGRVYKNAFGECHIPSLLRGARELGC